jgi:hypothetical protein
MNRSIHLWTKWLVIAVALIELATALVKFGVATRDEKKGSYFQQKEITLTYGRIDRSSN